MTNELYPKTKDKILQGGVNWVGDTINAVLLKYGYNYNTAHEFLSAISSDMRIATVTLSGKSVLNGTAFASNPTFTAVTGDRCEGVLIYKETGDAATSPILTLHDAGGQITVGTAAQGATSINISAAPVAITAGAILRLVSGTGPSAITVTTKVDEEGTSATVGALTSAVTDGAVYNFSNVFAVPNGNDILVLFDSNGIFSI